MRVLIYEEDQTLVWQGELNHLPAIGDTIFTGIHRIVINRVFNVFMGFVNIYIK